jgi:hypothetical protein
MADLDRNGRNRLCRRRSAHAWESRRASGGGRFHLAVFTGAMRVWASLKLRQAVDGEWILALDGIGTIGFGVALLIWPPGIDRAGLAHRMVRGAARKPFLWA